MHGETMKFDFILICLYF